MKRRIIKSALTFIFSERYFTTAKNRKERRDIKFKRTR
ncbi:hypothetical protein CLSAB_19120 [Clostridium saccharobutylicum]|nr:hypothetical protein CLSAB_19120 [Clostridium saccharobutylicum]